ncbi:MarR family winged helix-turn-helix transcriptional regulator [Weissella bombi]|uniref:HTH-type transcriptional regulator SarZ n=1 Tax=Weissella bombi TaxID=1505725 RepID=A0A1C3ZM02_9LACO|nr:MarR family transcriptional regulator [Weissella bombi]SCB83250.1 DNA-binding transcriptional regulator, MarR family [Weissella bombi]
MVAHEIDLANQLCFSIYNANRLFAKFYQQALDEFQLTYPQYLVMLALWENEPINLRELGQKLHLASNTLTPLLKRLEQNGWLTRVRPTEDKRQLVVSLTPKGQQLKPLVEERLAECVKDMGGFDTDEYQKMLDDNQKLITTLLKLV